MEKNRTAAIEWLSQEYEIKMAKKLEFTRIISTIGPMLGLMGTLIPMGPALVALAGGDLLTLAHN
jgi:biopolymer transport protein ExbB/TolQ